MDKLQFLVLMFAVLLSKLCNVLLCSYNIYLSKFFDSQDSDSPTHKIVENYKALGTNMHYCAEFHDNRSENCRDMAI